MNIKDYFKLFKYKKLSRYKMTRQIVSFGVIALRELLGDGKQKTYSYGQFADVIEKLIKEVHPKEAVNMATEYISISDITPLFFVQLRCAIPYSIRAMEILKDKETDDFTYDLFAKAMEEAIMTYSPYNATEEMKRCINEEFTLELQK